MSYPQITYNYRGVDATLTWIIDSDIQKYTPVTQAYGIVFNTNNEILISRPKIDANWQLPGGTPEEAETIEQTLRRELLEEADVTAGKIYPLGAQRVEMKNNPKKYEGDLFYQLRFVVELDQVLPQTPDPDNGNIWERMFVPMQKVTQYIQWGATGDAMFADAIKLWKEKKYV